MQIFFKENLQGTRFKFFVKMINLKDVQKYVKL